MKNILVIPNKEKASAVKYAKKISNWLKKANAPKTKFAIILGGDGTIIKSARELAPQNIPLLGVNLGEMGFLTNTNIKDTFSSIRKILSGKYKIEERSMLNIQVYRNKKLLNSFIALNDAVIKNGKSARVINLKLNINKKPVSKIVGDGLIVSTPTGSTAYCLASGGPIVQPQSKVLIVTPVSPHSLTQRPLVLAENDDIVVEVASNHNEVILSMDGQIHIPLDIRDTVKMTVSDVKTKLIIIDKNNYFKILKEKLKWGT